MPQPKMSMASLPSSSSSMAMTTKVKIQRASLLAKTNHSMTRDNPKPEQLQRFSIFGRSGHSRRSSVLSSSVTTCSERSTSSSNSSRRGESDPLLIESHERFARAFVKSDLVQIMAQLHPQVCLSQESARTRKDGIEATMMYLVGTEMTKKSRQVRRTSTVEHVGGPCSTTSMVYFLAFQQEIVEDIEWSCREGGGEPLAFRITRRTGLEAGRPAIVRALERVTEKITRSLHRKPKRVLNSGSVVVTHVNVSDVSPYLRHLSHPRDSLNVFCILELRNLTKSKSKSSKILWTSAIQRKATKAEWHLRQEVVLPEHVGQLTLTLYDRHFLKTRKLGTLVIDVQDLPQLFAKEMTYAQCMGPDENQSIEMKIKIHRATDITTSLDMDEKQDNVDLSSSCLLARGSPNNRLEIQTWTKPQEYHPSKEASWVLPGFTLSKEGVVFLMNFAGLSLFLAWMSYQQFFSFPVLWVYTPVGCSSP